MQLSTGFTLGPYEILELIGTGGMGEVYRARDTRLGRLVAIKILRSEFSTRIDLRQRFLREAHAISNLSHPHICALYDIGNQDAMDYLVMELLDGETLAERLRRGRLQLGKIVHYAAEIADALNHAHAQGVYHRDLKPSNIILTQSGLKILDFGLARWKDPIPSTSLQPSEITLSAPGTLLGTLPYMSPEQIDGKEGDASTDIFSLGVVLYEMVSGNRPFKGNTQASLAASILSDQPEITPEMQKHPPLSRVIQRCLVKTPEDRWQNARDLMLELQWIEAELLSSGRYSKISVDSVPAGTLRWRQTTFVVLAALIVFAALFFAINGNNRFRLSKPFQGEIKTLAVLPLRNLSGDPQQEYLADAMTEELISTISKIESLRVISRTSVMGYKNVQKPLPEIARELHADVILEGSILKVGNQMRVTAQLIHAPSDQHLWAQSYDRNLGDMLGLLNEVATSIAREIQIKLTPEEKAHLANAVRVKPEAYQAYLRGKYFLGPPDLTEVNPELATEMFERAVQLDPQFALAYAELGRANASAYFWIGEDKDRANRAKAAIDQAFKLHPGLAEAHVALGYYYYAVQKDYPRALQEYLIAEKDLPRNTTLLAMIAAAYRRLANYDAAAEKLKFSFGLGPRDARMAWDLASTYSINRKYAEADRYFNIAISLAPDQPSGYSRLAWNYLLWNGDTLKARRILEKIPSTLDSEAEFAWYVLEMCDRNYEAALKHRLVGSDNQAESAFMAGYVYSRTNRSTAARSSYEKARAIWEEAVKEQPGSVDIHSALGRAYAALGTKEDALREVKLAETLLPVSKDAVFGPDRLEDQAFTYVLMGDYDSAIKVLEYLVSIPARDISPAILRISPRWDPLRNDPRFQKIVQTEQ